ncbi:MAG: OsmC family protein [Bacteroidota bacterium]
MRRRSVRSRQATRCMLGASLLGINRVNAKRNRPVVSPRSSMPTHGLVVRNVRPPIEGTSMTEIQTTVTWERGDAQFTDGKYSRAHSWSFDGGAVIAASSSPHIVPSPFSIESAVDPEEAFVASLSSCHMLWFLSIAAKRGLRINCYRDLAIGEMGRNEHGKLVVSIVRLRPSVDWDGNVPTESEIIEMHQKAHEECFIANSVRTSVLMEPIVNQTNNPMHASGEVGRFQMDKPSLPSRRVTELPHTLGW